MKRKLVAIISVVAMLVTMIPATVFAETPPGAQEMTPEELLESAEADKITLQDDVHLKSSLKIDNQKNLTIDLNGHTLSAAEKTIIIDGGSLNVVGPGKVVETSPNYAPILIQGSTDTSAEDYSVVSVGKNVYLEGWSGIFVNNNNGKACGVEVDFAGEINSVRDTRDDAGHGIYINGLVQDTTNFPIIDIKEGSEINSLGTGIYAAGYGKWTINGTINGSVCGLGIKAGKFTINKNARISATDEPSDPVGFGNGIYGIGAAIQLESNDAYAGQIEMDINGGEIVSENSVAICEYNGNDTDKPSGGVKSVTINDGTIKSGEGMPAIKTRMEEDKSLNFLNTVGGSYSAPINSIYCAVDKAPIVDSTGNCHIIDRGDIPTGAVVDENGCFYESNDAIAKHNEATVTTNNVTTAYPTLEEAVEAAEAGSTINLMKDVEIKDVVKISNDKVTFNGNGHQIKLKTDKMPGIDGKPPVNYIILVEGDEVIVQNVKLNDEDSKAKHGVQFYKSRNSKMSGVTVTGTAWTGVLVNGSQVDISNSVLNPAAGSYATIEYAMGENVTNVTDVPEITLNNVTTNGKFVVWADYKTLERVKSTMGSSATDDTAVEKIRGNITTNNNDAITISIGMSRDNTSKNEITIPSTKPSTGGKPSTPSVTKDRVAGADRFETAIKVADQLKKELGVVKFNNIVVAYSDEFADALSATALAADKDAPILVVNKNNESTVKTYIANNLNKGGNVYIIGGTAVVSESFEKSLTGCKVTRLGGADRYETNLAVLRAIGVTGASDIMVASGLKYPDALSASATGNPVILVGKTLNDNQKAYLATLGGNDDYYVIGGTAAVNATVMNQLNASKLGTVTRLGGDTRYETGLAVADEFFTNARNVVIASGDDFPDGLTGGVLANAMNAPLMLVNQYNTDVAADYVDDNSVRTVIAIGGTTVIPDATLNKVA